MKIIDIVQEADIPLAEYLPIFNDRGERIGISRSPTGATFFAQQNPGQTIWRVHPITGNRIVGVRYLGNAKYAVVMPDKTSKNMN